MMRPLRRCAAASCSARCCGRSGCSSSSRRHGHRDRCSHHRAAAAFIGIVHCTSPRSSRSPSSAWSAGSVQVRRGLSPSTTCAPRLAGRARRARRARLTGDYPTEVQPLVDDLNALLDAPRAARARAHGEGRRPRARPEDAARRPGARGRARARPRATASWRRRSREQVDRMRRQVDYHLAHARAAAVRRRRRAHAAHVAESADGLARTLLRLHADRGLAIDVHVPADARRRACQREDLDEMLGNLLDNACKWARAPRVGVASRSRRRARRRSPSTTTGPGSTPAMREARAAARRARRRSRAGLGPRPGHRARSGRALRRLDRARRVAARRPARTPHAAGRRIVQAAFSRVAIHLHGLDRTR